VNDRLNSTERKIFGETPQRPMTDDDYVASADLAYSIISQALHVVVHLVHGDSDRGDIGGILQGAIDAIIRFTCAGNGADEALVREMLQDFIDHLLPQAIADRDLGAPQGAA
jgi:hypothetical protein